MSDRIFLHGWGKDKKAYLELLNLTDAKFIGLPGFEEPLPRPFNLDDYVSCLDLKVKGRVTIITHSFGGRVAVKFAVAHPEKINKLILIASGGIERKNAKIIVLNKLAKITPHFFKNYFSNILGSTDYRSATGFLKETLKNVVSEDLEYLLPEIKVPTLIIWGDKDNTTPIWQGEVFQKNITGSKMVIIPGGDHGIPYRKVKEVATAINEFI